MDVQDAKQQIERMVAFIINEANDKVAELNIKTVEDYNLEKLKTLQKLKLEITKEISDQYDKHVTEKRIEKCKLRTNSKLRILTLLDTKTNEVAHAAIDEINQFISSNSSKYTELCSDLIVEAMITMCRPQVLVQCRKSDAHVIQKAITLAKHKFINILKENGLHNASCEISLDESMYLPEQFGKNTCNGGVIILSADKVISVDNTLQARFNNSIEHNRGKLKHLILNDLDISLK